MQLPRAEGRLHDDAHGQPREAQDKEVYEGVEHRRRQSRGGYHEAAHAQAETTTKYEFQRSR